MTPNFILHGLNRVWKYYLSGEHAGFTLDFQTTNQYEIGEMGQDSDGSYWLVCQIERTN